MQFNFLEINSQIVASAVKYWGLEKNYSRCSARFILGLLLFKIFLNNIFFFLKDASLGNYANDSTLYAYSKNLETAICNLRQEFSILSNWFCDNYMVLIPGKCHSMLFGVKENEQFGLMCNGITLKHSSHKKI